jgi:undecaprenyl diphosphate synthase
MGKYISIKLSFTLWRDINLSKYIFQRIPTHVGVIPDGNRRWAERNGMSKEKGYDYGIAPGFRLYEMCIEQGIQELTLYGFTQDNTKRPVIQRKAFQKACVDAVGTLANRDADLLVVGNTKSPMFPKELLPYTKERVRFGKGLIKVNFLVNYSWQWDLHQAISAINNGQVLKTGRNITDLIGSSQISRVDLMVRWGGRRRLSGFLPVQSIYSDFYVLEALWPDFKDVHFLDALRWYQKQDITLGG